MWEQRYGFPEPERTTAGYRLYSEGDVDALRRVVSVFEHGGSRLYSEGAVAALRRVLSFREPGLSVPAAVERVRGAEMATDRPSLYGALAGGDAPLPAQVLTKRALLAISRAIEDETISRAAAPVVIGAFQSERNY